MATLTERIPYTDIDYLFIGGERLKPQGRCAVVNPASEEVIGEAPLASRVDAEAAIQAARDAFDNGPWPLMSRQERGQHLLRFQQALLADAPRIASLLVAEAGAISAFAQGMHVMGPILQLGAEIERCRAEPQRMIDLAVNPGFGGAVDTLSTGLVVRDPVGVVAGIASFNFPFVVCMSKVIPALLAGNTLVLKPSPYTPFTALLLAQMAERAALPRGVLNIVNGEADVGTVITTDPRVDMVSFTGSDTTGALIAQQAAKTLKRVFLELGGKSALIVRHDADLRRAIQVGLLHTVIQAGQACLRCSRHIVHNSIRPAYVEAMRAAAASIKVGNPLDPTVGMGPLIRERQRAHVERFVEIGRQEGAKLVHGGGRPAGIERGYFHDITIFDDVDNSMTIAQQEIFGPVSVVIGFDDDEQAVKIANDSQFGLGGAIETGDPARALAMARRIRTGGIDINGGGPNPNAPFGGVKRSGYGREFGPDWLNEYTTEKAIVLPAGFGRPS